MSARHLASLTQIRRPASTDVDAPFRHFHQAGLVNAQFAIDYRQPFWRYHDPGRRWNGWETLEFLRQVADLIADWVNHDEPGTAWWVGDVLHVQGDEVEDSVSPDDLELYRFDG